MDDEEIFQYNDESSQTLQVYGIDAPPSTIGNKVKIQLFGDSRLLTLMEVDLFGQ